MNTIFIIAVIIIIALLFAIFGALTNILMALHHLARVTRETPILTRPSSFRRES